MGAALLYFLAAGMVSAVPAGFGFAAHALLSRRGYVNALDRTAQAIMGLGLAASALGVCCLFGRAFAEVML